MAKARTVVTRYYGFAQIALVVAAVEAYELLRHAMRPNWAVAERHAQDVLSLERFAHIEWEEGLQRTFLRAPDLVRAMNVFYFVGHFAVTGVFFFWLYHANRGAFRRFRNGFLSATFLALVVHWQFPTAPPRLAGVGLEDTLRRLSNIDIGSPTSASFSNPVAAVPSLHAGWAVGVGVGLVLYARPLLWRAIGVLYPVAVVLTIVVTGNHFVFDALAGVAVMGLGFWLSDALSRRSSGHFRSGAVLQSKLRRGVEQSGSSPGS
jgi:PAP2 superfamily